VFISYAAGESTRFLGIEAFEVAEQEKAQRKYAENLSKSSIKSILNFRYPK
jgi:hypothetical protein